MKKQTIDDIKNQLASKNENTLLFALKGNLKHIKFLEKCVKDHENNENSWAYYLSNEEKPAGLAYYPVSDFFQSEVNTALLKARKTQLKLIKELNKLIRAEIAKRS